MLAAKDFNVRTLRRWIVPAAVTIILFFLPAFAPSYWVFLATSIVISAIAVASLGVLTGMAGQISLCQLSFAGIGAWVMGYFVAQGTELPFLIQIALSALAAVPFGILIGLPALRLRGVNLAIVTLGFAYVTDLFFTVSEFPNTSSFKPISRPSMLSNDQNFYWFTLAIAVVVLLVLRWLPHRRLGSSWLAVKHSERATASLGLSVPGTKLTAFSVSAFIAGISGALMAAQFGFVNARNFDPTDSLIIFAVAVMVSARYPGGALLAGAMQWIVPEILTTVGLPKDLGNLIFVFGTIQALSAGGGVFEQINRKRKEILASTSNAEIAIPTDSADKQLDSVENCHEAVLELNNITVSYGKVVAVNAIDLAVPKGQVMGLIGPNGAGKSSLVDAVTGFTPYSGNMTLNGQTIDRLSPTKRARMGLRRTFQQDRTIPDLSVQAYLNLAAGRILNVGELDYAMDFAGVPHKDIELHSLNVGTRRLLEVVGVLTSKPDVILMDEPAAGLSIDETMILGRHIIAIPARYGCSVLLIEHDMELIRHACQTVTVIDFGQKIAEGPTLETLALPRVVAAYLGEEVDE